MNKLGAPLGDSLRPPLKTVSFMDSVEFYITHSIDHYIYNHLMSSIWEPLWRSLWRSMYRISISL